MSPLGHPGWRLLRGARVSHPACSRIEIMKTNHYLILSTMELLALGLAGCSDGERAVVAGPGKLTSIDQRRSLANPLKAEQGNAQAGGATPRKPPKGPALACQCSSAIAHKNSPEGLTDRHGGRVSSAATTHPQTGVYPCHETAPSADLL